MIYITGDTHGLKDVKKFESERFLKEIDKPNNYVIITGDMGVAWNEETMKNCIAFYSKFNCKFLFVDGNNENFDILDKLPISKFKGGNVHKIGSNIYHLMRGEIFDIDNVSILAFGGADSWDSPKRCKWTNRITGASYWDRECPSKKEFENALKNIQERNGKVDLIVSHECTSDLARHFGSLTADVCKMLDKIEKITQYRYWVFGHHHHNVKFGNKICIFNIFEKYDDLVKNNEMILKKI